MVVRRENRENIALVAGVMAVFLWSLLSPFGAYSQQTELHRVTLSDAEAEIAKALQESGAGDNIRISVIGRPSGTLVSSNFPISTDVGDLSFDEKTRGWSASLYFETDGRPLAPVRLSGRYDELLRLPVLSHRMNNGEIISQDDISWKFVPASRLRKDAVVDSTAVIGMMPARTISRDRYIRRSELISPPVVEKGDIVTMNYRKGGLSIVTSGVALDSGASGDRIRIRNSSSNVIVRAVISNSGEVIVSESGIVEQNPQKQYARKFKGGR